LTIASLDIKTQFNFCFKYTWHFSYTKTIRMCRKTIGLGWTLEENSSHQISLHETHEILDFALSMLSVLAFLIKRPAVGKGQQNPLVFFNRIKVAGVTSIAIFSKWKFLKMVGSITSRWLLTYTKSLFIYDLNDWGVL